MCENPDPQALQPNVEASKMAVMQARRSGTTSLSLCAYSPNGIKCWEKEKWWGWCGRTRFYSACDSSEAAQQESAIVVFFFFLILSLLFCCCDPNSPGPNQPLTSPGYPAQLDFSSLGFFFPRVASLSYFFFLLNVWKSIFAWNEVWQKKLQNLFQIINFRRIAKF